jgi:hypothetical protein
VSDSAGITRGSGGGHPADPDHAENKPGGAGLCAAVFGQEEILGRFERELIGLVEGE